MIQSAAHIKVKTLAPWKELRLQKRKAKKLATIERKANKVCFPSPVTQLSNVVEQIEEKIDEPTRDEMIEQADKIGLKVDKRWSDETLLKRINEAMTWDTASASL